MAKIAIPYDDGRVFEHFGRSRHFMFCEISNGKIMSSEVVDVDFPGSGSAVADFLGRSRVDILICSGVGEGARGHLVENHVEIVAGASGDAREAAESYARGELKHNPTCFHAEGRCSH